MRQDAQFVPEAHGITWNYMELLVRCDVSQHGLVPKPVANLMITDDVS